jgi:hypothetical protein
MAITLKRANGYLPNPVGVLYTCPAATQAFIKTIVVVNEDVVVREFELYADPAALLISATPTSLNAGAMYRDTDGHVLQAGDTLSGWSDAGSVCNYRLAIMEKS